SSSSNSNVSFGVYDISSSGPSISRDLISPSEPASTTLGDTATGSGRGVGGGNGGGGGGGRSERNGITVENVSLEQALTSQKEPSDRKILRNAELSLETEQPEESQKKIAAIAQSKGGFVVESQQSVSDVRVNSGDIVQMSVRVPADKFTEAVDEIRAVASRVIVETVKGEDVTEEFIDIEARLKAKKALEQQFMEIMKRANSVDDALSVQSQLADVRGEIEKIEGRKRFLENQAQLSTIKLRLQTPAVFTSNSSGFSYRLSDSFAKGFDIALNFILGLVTFVIGALPLAVFVGLPGYLIIRAIIRKRSRPMSVTEIANEELRND
ncbi:MAG: DUF4349 domain-containing protein, partial [Acidobacteriota bacterium]